MKNKFKSIFLLALSAGVLATSCSEDDNTGASMINFTSPTVTLTTANNNVVVDESMIDPDLGYSIAVTASIPEPVFADLHIPLVQTGGTGDSADFTAGTIIISSGQTSASANVTIWRECESGVEGDETLTISYADNIANAVMTSFALNISIENDWINDNLLLEFDWAGSFTYDASVPAEVTIDFCDVDLDILLADAGGNILGYLAGTGDCPEEAELSGMPNGTYYVLAEVYDNPFAALGINEPMPITTSYTQCGFDTEGSFSDSIMNTDTPNGDIFPIATITISGYNYTVVPF
jgi:hypothetical protein